MLIKLFYIFIFFSNLLFACAVCYGNPESNMSQGMNMGVLTLMGFIVFILSIIVYSIISMSQRIKNINKTEGKI